MDDDELATLRLEPLRERPRGAVALVVLGPGAPLTYDLALRGDVMIGRAAGCQIVIDDASLSRHHAVLHVDAASDVLAIEDLDSANGVTVAGTRIPARRPHPIEAGTVLELGNTTILVQRVAPPRHGARGGGRGGHGAATAARAAGAMAALDAVVAKVARSDLSVLLVGETGVGKEVLAERIHRLSSRAAGPFVRLHCAALSSSLLESELFGHEKGAFTGATQQKPGLLETAEGGTLFLDEVGEVPPETQVKLLRVLEARAVLRVGALKPRAIDVRFVAATNRDLQAEIDRGAFRQDLYFRLDGITLTIPPLRERTGEIESLTRSFAGGVELSRDTVAALLAHPWPGNVRELRNVIQRAVVLAGGGPIGPEHLSFARPKTVPPAPASSSGSLRDDVEAVEHQRIVDAMNACGGNQSQAAKMLGISRSTLLSRLDRFGITRPRKR